MYIWKYEINGLIKDLEFSRDALTPIIAQITKLRNDCVRSADNLDNVILAIKTNIKNQIKKWGFHIEQKEKEYNSIGGCSFFSSLFSGGGCQRAKDRQKREIRDLQAKLRGQIKTYNDVERRLKYFDALKKLAKTLASEADKLLDSAKNLKEAIQRTLTNLKSNYTNEDIEDTFGPDGD